MERDSPIHKASHERGKKKNLVSHNWALDFNSFDRYLY